MHLTPVGKALVVLATAGVGFGVYRSWSKIAPKAQDKTAVVPKKITLPGEVPSGLTSTGANAVTFSSDTGGGAGCTDKPEVRLLGYAWNAQMGMLYATGGPQATQGSLMCKHGVNFRFQRQDDNGKLQESLVAFANDLKNGTAQPKRGAHFVAIMGDGSAAFLKGLNDTLRRLGPDYTAKIVTAIGYSRGEDKFMGPIAWKTNPQASKGGLVAGVLRDGDWNIAQKWLGDNGLKTNPDEKTYDPDALNWVAADDYLDAPEKYIAGYSETRPVVRNGKRTGETKTVKVDGVVTWTPGDVNVAEKKGGLVSVVSTREYASQMPCTVIGIDKWMRANRATVENMIQAIGEGGQAVKTNSQALRKGAEVSALVYKEETAAYWEKFYRGVTQTDKTGQQVELGGSSANNLADSLLAFGLLPGSANLVSATYTVFGEVVTSQYPELVPSVDPATKVIDTSYLQGLAKRAAPSRTIIAETIKPVYRPQKPGRKPNRTLSKRAVYITFNPGKATFSPTATQVLESVSRDLLVAGGTAIEIHGHTDNQGSARTSLPLSQARANAVARWLETRAPVNFPQSRIRAFAHGESQPIVPNTSDANRARNRRVEIVLTTPNA